MPERVQLKRTKGWRKPPKTVSVARPGRFGNPFVVTYTHTPGTVIDEDRGTIATSSPEAAVNAFRYWLQNTVDGGAVLDEARGKLRGLNLACWCRPGAPCHADVLLELANS